MDGNTNNANTATAHNTHRTPHKARAKRYGNTNNANTATPHKIHLTKLKPTFGCSDVPMEFNHRQNATKLESTISMSICTSGSSAAFPMECFENIFFQRYTNIPGTASAIASLQTRV